MIVLNGKKAKYIITAIFVIILIIAITIVINSSDSKYVDTVSLPVSGKIIVVDAGHGVPEKKVSLLKS